MDKTQLAHAIGECLIAFNELEVELNDLLSMLITGDYHATALVVFRMDARPKIESISRIFAEHYMKSKSGFHARERAIWAEVSPSLPRITRIRNYLAHALWTRDKVGNLIAISARDGSTLNEAMGLVSITLQALQSYKAEVMRIKEKIAEAHDPKRELPRPSLL